MELSQVGEIEYDRARAVSKGSRRGVRAGEREGIPDRDCYDVLC